MRRHCLRLGLSWQLGTSYMNLGIALLHAGFHDEAVTTLRQGGGVFREIGDAVFAARIDNMIAHASLAGDEIAESDRLTRGVLMTASALKEPQGIADGLYTLAAIAAARGDPERAATLAGAALPFGRRSPPGPRSLSKGDSGTLSAANRRIRQRGAMARRMADRT